MLDPSEVEDARRYPLLLDLAGRDVLVVGGGPVAARRVAGLLAAGGRIHVIAPTVCEDLAELISTSAAVRWIARQATASDVLAGPRALAADVLGEDAEPVTDVFGQPSSDATDLLSESPAQATDARWWLVHTATGVPEVDRAVADAADDAGIWCVRADRAGASPGHVPAVAHGPDGVQVAVSGGGDPGRARAIRDAISDLLATGRLPLRRSRPPRRAALAGPDAATPEHFAHPGPTRPRVSAAGVDPRAVDDASGVLPERGERAGQSDGSTSGVVVLVGGGPGDPGLLTVAGRQWLARADVVITDRLAPTSVLAELDPAVEVIDVGKVAGNHPIPQHEINRLLVDRARRGEVVVRLKGGDSFVLGRGGEEALHCIEHGVAVEVVPGVTSAVSVAAAAGIPVTHRGITTSFVVASAHAGAGSAQRAAENAPDDATLVLLMGLSALTTTAAELVAAGRPAETAVAVVSRGWTPEQRTVVGTLDTIAADVQAAALPGPAIVVVGDVVRLREQLLPLDRMARLERPVRRGAVD